MQTSSCPSHRGRVRVSSKRPYSSGGFAVNLTKQYESDFAPPRVVRRRGYLRER
jgi:hypothetical protein